VLGIPSALGEQFLGFMDGLATNYLLPLGALLIAGFTGWVLTRDELRNAFSAGEISPFRFMGWWLLIRFISPVAVILIFLHQLGLF
jgi:neurotransmitter:Na+ symporter, NSS family